MRKLDTNIKSEKSSCLDEGWNLVGRIKVGSVPEIKNKEVLALFINLHNELKCYLPRKISKLITLCILKKAGRLKGG